MVPQTLTYKPLLTPSYVGREFVRQFDKLIKKISPRPCILRSIEMLLIGWGVPFLMLLEVIPTTLLLGFVALAFTATGSVMLLFYLGDI